MSFTVEFINNLANQPIDMMTVDASGLSIAAPTISVVETQIGASDTPVDPAVNSISFGSSLRSGNFSIQHSDINTGTPVEMSVNNVNVNLQEVTTGVSPVTGIQAKYTIFVSGPPDANYLQLAYLGDNSTPLSFKWDGTDVLFKGSAYSSIQQALDDKLGAGVWTLNGRPINMVMEFFGPTTSFGTSPWTIQYDGWAATGHPVTDLFYDGYSGIPQQYTLTVDGLPSSGNLTLHYSFYVFVIPYNGLNVNLNGHVHATLADAVASINLSYGDFGPWAIRGTPALGNNWDANLIFYGRQQSTGSNPWSITSNGWDVNVSESWTEGTAPSAGVYAVHSLALEGAFDGTFAINSFDGIPWNLDVNSLANIWGNNTGQAVTPNISGTGISSDPWVITYHDPEPISLPTIDGSALAGFTDSYLQTQIGNNFTVSGADTSPYILTSHVNGVGQTAIVVSSVDLVSGVSITGPSTQQAGSAGTGGAYAHFTITTDIVPTSSFIEISYSGNIFPIRINFDNTDINGDSIQTRLNNIGLGGWTYSGSPASRSMVFTRNAQQSYGSNAWLISDDNWAGVTISSLFTDGAYPTGTATAIQRWVSPAHQGATGGTFYVTGDATTVGPCSWNMNLSDLSAVWTAATGHSLSFATGFGTSMAPFEFHFSDNIPITLPTIDASGLTKSGTVSNNFTDGTSIGGQNEIQTVTLADNPTGGTWSISYNNDNTISPLDHNIAQQDLQAALRVIWGISTINVSLSENVYTIDFGVHAPQFGTDSIQANGSGLTKQPTPIVTEFQHGQTLS